MPPGKDTEVTDDIGEMDDQSISNTVDDAGDLKRSEKPADAASSTAPDVSNTVADEDALSVVRDVVDKRPKAETEAPSATAAAATPAGQARQKEPDDEAFSDVPFNKHPRFQELLQQRNDFKTDAVRYRNVQDFIDNNGLSAEEAAELLTVGGLIKVDPGQRLETHPANHPETADRRRRNPA